MLDMTSRTSVYMTDELREAVSKDGRSLSDLIRAGLGLPSPVRFSKTDVTNLEGVKLLAERALRAAQGSDDSQISSGQGRDGSQRRSGRGPGKKARPAPAEPFVSAKGCIARVPPGAYCRDCQSAHAATTSR
jgi:hypothetical protein